MAFGSISFGSFGLKTSEDFTITDGGTLELNKLASYPVGSIYQSIDPTSPAELFGGVWESIASNRVLMGVSEEHPAGSTVEAGLPNINGTLKCRTINSTTNLFFPADAEGSLSAKEAVIWSGNHLSYSPQYSTNCGTQTITMNAANLNTIYGNSTTVQPSAYFINIWLRLK